MCGNLLCTNRKLIEQDIVWYKCYDSPQGKFPREGNTWAESQKMSRYEKRKGRKDGFWSESMRKHSVLVNFFWNEKGNKQLWHIGECGV